jgi:hypothetical protein
MPPSYPVAWLPRILFYVIMSLGLGLILLVLTAPWLDQGANRAIELFARDALLRRTALASACGLAVAACVFFRPPGLPRRLSAKKRQDPPPPPLAGA